MNSQDCAYTVAVLADVHGNAAALSAVLNALDDQTFDTLVFAGDLVLNGPRPAETLDTIRALNVPTIFGNADRYVCDPNHPGPGVQWVRERLDTAAIAYLSDLPFAHRITPPGGESPTDDLLVVHATPTDVEAMLILEPDRFGLLTVTPQFKAERMLGTARADLILAGHLHYASSGRVGDRRCATVGSVGFPYDGDTRAAYAQAIWDGHSWEVVHCRVSYEHLQVAAEVEHSGFPFAVNSAERLRRARFIPQV
ncbi:MAG: hypothetical protein F4X83_08945 [Chloroflexi bacterium]|nr:hypothetical protein [Chloroflexota bacterium]